MKGTNDALTQDLEVRGDVADDVRGGRAAPRLKGRKLRKLFKPGPRSAGTDSTDITPSANKAVDKARATINPERP